MSLMLFRCRSTAESTHHYPGLLHAGAVTSTGPSIRRKQHHEPPPPCQPPDWCVMPKNDQSDITLEKQYPIVSDNGSPQAYRTVAIYSRIYS